MGHVSDTSGGNRSKPRRNPWGHKLTPQMQGSILLSQASTENIRLVAEVYNRDKNTVQNLLNKARKWSKEKVIQIVELYRRFDEDEKKEFKKEYVEIEPEPQRHVTGENVYDFLHGNWRMEPKALEQQRKALKELLEQQRQHVENVAFRQGVAWQRTVIGSSKVKMKKAPPGYPSLYNEISVKERYQQRVKADRRKRRRLRRMRSKE